jgi:3-deoxy-manno-octulosonate cytidylyltransferase (CMP-KDO synthetase)
MIRRVYEQASHSDAKAVYVATDDARIADEVERFGGRFVMTSPDHSTGTDRIFEAASRIGLGDNDIVVNVQGDEPLIPPSVINKVAEMIDPNVQMSTLCELIVDSKEVFDPNVVKVVADANDIALYFSRAPIPWSRDYFGPGSVPDGVSWYRHLGIYAYTAAMLARFITWDPSPLEEAEKLEQLRALSNGEKIKIAISPDKIPPGIDVPEDVERTLKVLKEDT